MAVQQNIGQRQHSRQLKARCKTVSIWLCDGDGRFIVFDGRLMTGVIFTSDYVQEMTR